MLQCSMIDIVSYLPSKRKQTSSGWISFNAPCCHNRGQSQDKRSRGGLKLNAEGWSFHCFNCGYTTSFTLGRSLSYKARKLLEWIGVDTVLIEQLNLESLRHRTINGLLESHREVVKAVEFEERDLPDNIEPLTDVAEEYLRNRKIPLDYPFLSKSSPRPGIVIPFTHNNQMVGSAIRFLDDRIPKYINDIQHGYVFGTDLQHDNWQYAIVVEGVFDALSINGLAVLHADVNDAQARLIRSLGKDIIVVPDQDTAGMALVDRAIELNWAVSIPEWPEGIKDVNDAVKNMGKLATLLTIVHAKESNKYKIEIKRKQLAKRL